MYFHLFQLFLIPNPVSLSVVCIPLSTLRQTHYFKMGSWSPDCWPSLFSNISSVNVAHQLINYTFLYSSTSVDSGSNFLTLNVTPAYLLCALTVYAYILVLWCCLHTGFLSLALWTVSWMNPSLSVPTYFLLAILLQFTSDALKRKLCCCSFKRLFWEVVSNPAMNYSTLGPLLTVTTPANSQTHILMSALCFACHVQPLPPCPPLTSLSPFPITWPFPPTLLTCSHYHSSALQYISQPISFLASCLLHFCHSFPASCLFCLPWLLPLCLTFFG